MRHENRKKNIGIDARPLQIIDTRSRGIGVYTKNLIDALLNYKNENYNFTCYSLNKTIFNDSSSSSRLDYIINRKSQRLTWLWNTAYLPAKILDSDVTLFHATDPFCIVKPTPFYRAIATIYDIIPLIYPNRYLLPTTIYRRYAYARSYSSIPSLDAVITISDFSKKDISKRLHIPLEKIYVTYPALGNEFNPLRNRDSIQKIKRKYQISGKYLLYVGGIDYRKNVISLLMAFALALHSFEDLSLVIVGNGIFNPLEPMHKKVHQTIRSLNLQKHVVRVGFIPTNDLAVLYSGSELLVFPSLYEGFGLPVLEAMACGSPVVCSNTSSIPEVAGDAAIFVNPKNINEIEQAIRIVLKNKTLAQNLRHLGINQAKKFSWEKTARQTIDVYDKIYSY